VISVIPAIVLSLATSHFDPNAQLMVIVTSILLYFISNLITSGTEEFGWRGVLYPELKSTGMSFWDIAWKGGIIWAVWHYPLMFIMYMPFGYAVFLPTLAGFTASIVAMNYITNFLYEKTQNIWAAVVLHALNNTMSFVLVIMFPETPFLIITSLMAWVIVGWLEKKYPQLK
jgi:membrane protease YdiL (CAAX protease family)